MGTTVEVVLPFKKAKRSDLPPTINPDERQDLSGIKALLVEDNELNMEIAHCMLEDENVIVTEAYNGEEAVRLFTENPPETYDIVLMDIMMPVMDGLTAARRIRESGKTDALTIPIFAMTANTFSEDIEASKNAGMNEHIAKPIEMNKLMGKIVQYCR